MALLIAPYLRRFGGYTIPDFLAARYDGALARGVGVAAAVLCSFIYLVAQIYGIGLITTWLTGVDFVIGIFLGLGGILVCSFLGGMRAVTWTQVAQYIVLIAAYLVPVAWLAVKQTGVPLAQAVYGTQLQKVTARERQLAADPREAEVAAAYRARAVVLRGQLRDVRGALADARDAARRRLDTLKAQAAPLRDIQRADRALAALPQTEGDAQAQWRRAAAAAEARSRPLGGLAPQALPYAGDPHGDAAARQRYDVSRRNFLALVLCLMVGTAGLPHILARCYTTATVAEARRSVAWSLLFITLLYVTVPALAVLVKVEVFDGLVGTPFAQLPAWVADWSRLDPSLLSVADVNHDGVLQLAEIDIGADIVVLAMPEIAGLPYVISALVAAGGLAAALSTADGLLLTISNALSHDVYHRMLAPQASATQRVTLSKVMLLVVALAAAAVAAQRPTDIVFLMSAAFSLAAASFFVPLVLGVFWMCTNRAGAAAGMVAGLAVTCGYMAYNEPLLRAAFAITAPPWLWWDIQPISAGVFGVTAALVATVSVSLLTTPPDAAARAFVKRLRPPDLD